jgi:uncharacterized protein
VPNKLTSDPVITMIRESARPEPQIEAIWLFGSRARNDAHARSDYDIAVKSPQISDEKWARWALHIREHAPTLCGIDLVRLGSDTASDLRKAIERDGILIYEGKKLE